MTYLLKDIVLPLMKQTVFAEINVSIDTFLFLSVYEIHNVGPRVQFFSIYGNLSYFAIQF